MSTPNTPPNKFASVLASAAWTNLDSGYVATTDLPVNVNQVSKLNEHPASYLVNLTQAIPAARVAAGLSFWFRGNAGAVQRYTWQLDDAGNVTALILVGDRAAEDPQFEGGGFHIVDVGW